MSRFPARRLAAPAAVALLMGVAFVPDCDSPESSSLPTPAPSALGDSDPELSREVGKRKRLVRSRTGRALSLDLEDKVEVPVDENGDIPMDFSPMKALQQCVENDLALRCAENTEGDLDCFQEAGTPPIVKVTHEFPPEIEGVVYRLSVGDTFTDFEVEMDDPVFAGQDLSGLCRGIKNRIYQGGDGEVEVADTEEIERLNRQLDNGDELLGDLNGLAVDSVDIGGGFTKVDLSSFDLPGFAGGIITTSKDDERVVFYTVQTHMNPFSIVVKGPNVETVLEEAANRYREQIAVAE